MCARSLAVCVRMAREMRGRRMEKGSGHRGFGVCTFGGLVRGLGCFCCATAESDGLRYICLHFLLLIFPAKQTCVLSIGACVHIRASRNSQGYTPHVNGCIANLAILIEHVKLLVVWIHGESAFAPPAPVSLRFSPCTGTCGSALFSSRQSCQDPKGAIATDAPCNSDTPILPGANQAT